ncbi:MAG: FAD-dependent oxidoreductase [Firmicutes bacterium]|jgi:2-polyprenyl-6-methoxyphenol hydroxylase-like FAD-dependent oxidoreductase|nr:FAD-dependent oxidoreductase [Bacillota bacterium]MDH7496390.1 FAD-dependent oxidoreductase [Bacillota bacterium]
MRTYSFNKTIPVGQEVDVLVVGGGPSGFAAAIAASRNGAKTMLIEKHGCIGGMATVGLVGPFMTSFDATGDTQIIRGVFEELVRRLEERGGAIHPSKVRRGTSYCAFIIPGHDHVTPFDPEWLKLVATEMVLESGVELLLHTQCLDVIKEGDRVTGVVAANKSGLQAIEAAVIVDCSGDADVAEWSGAPTVLGRQSDHGMQPATMFFRICNVDSEKVKAYIEENRTLVGKPFHGPFSWLVEEARERGEWDVPRGEINMYETPNPGEWRVNTTRILNIDGTNARDVTRAEIEGRRQARKVFEFIKSRIPGCERARFMDTAAVVGIRETRHIVGEYVVTKEDVLGCRMFDDSILLASNSVDIHSKDAESGEYTVISGRWYGIPYRSLVPLSVENLLVAGRPISATSEASSAFRVMPCCIGTGQAAGTAAALAVKSGVVPRRVDVSRLRDLLREQGVYLG